MDMFMPDQAGFWLALGFALLIIELIALGMATGVLLFGGIGALLTGALVWFGFLPSTFLAAMASFAVCTAVATAVLWQPFKRLQSGAELGNDRSSDLIGHRFLLNADISESEHGQQKFSGIHWRVEPGQELKDKRIAAGTPVKVTAVGAGVFYVQADTVH